jgi:hypothetical protein
LVYGSDEQEQRLSERENIQPPLPIGRAIGGWKLKVSQPTIRYSRAATGIIHA